MDAQQLSDLDDAALLEAGKKKEKELQIDRFIVGMVVGIAIYSLQPFQYAFLNTIFMSFIKCSFIIWETSLNNSADITPSLHAIGTFLFN